MATESKEELKRALAEIEQWEKDQKDLWFWEKLGRLPFALLDRITPKALRAKISQMLDEIGGYVQTGGRYLISPKGVLARLDRTWRKAKADREIETPAKIDSIEAAAQLPLAVMNAAAADLRDSRKNMAFLQGATTGFGGLFTLAIDIPAVLGLSLKVLQEIAICYGFDPDDPKERVFIVKCLQFASSDIVGKQAILADLSAFDDESRQKQVISQIQGWRETVASYVDSFGWKKLFQIIPIAGMVFGAFMNKSAIEDTAEAGTMLYRKRRIRMKLQQE